MTPRTDPTIEIGPEVEDAHGWRYEVTLARDASKRSTHVVTLSWVDYDHWSKGDKPPSLVLTRLLEAAFELEPALIMPGLIDASTLRRMVRGLDDALAKRL